jgi:hypothetical protein
MSDTDSLQALSDALAGAVERAAPAVLRFYFAFAQDSGSGASQ